MHGGFPKNVISKIVTNRYVLSLLVIILILFLLALSIYGLRTCCRSGKTILEISGCNSDIVEEGGYTWSKLFIDHSASNTDAEVTKGCFDCVLTCNPHRSRNKVILAKDIKISESCEDESHNTKGISWKNMSHLREKRMPFLRSDRWFSQRRRANSKISIGEDLQDLEASSLDLLICKLDSLVLTFKSSDASRSSATSISSIAVDNTIAESEKCLPLVTIN